MSDTSIVIYVQNSTCNAWTSYDLECQVGACRDWLKKKRLPSTSAHVISDVDSGSGRDRTGLDELLELCKEGRVQHVIATTRGRLSRDPQHMSWLMHNFVNCGVAFDTIVP